ncbi:MAG TPA: SDR family NAD(P)-dependent oxidoreductase [Acidimicrobiales bacterium]|nr:SDR family NAD(P)-dependent oxidoreductase [Acidimicrobiales bacterium]
MRDSTRAVQSVLVLGGSSELGVAIAGRLAAPRQAAVVLAGRDPERLAGAARQVKAAGAGRVETMAFDATAYDTHEAVVGRATSLVGDLDVVVLAFGLLGAHVALDRGAVNGEPSAVEVAATNYVGVVSAGLAAVHRLREQGHGTLVVLSSVAGVRVRAANFVYGSSKAGADGFAQGLRDALAGTGADVLIVRPGWVHGRMTEGMPPAPMATTPEAVADGVAAALAAGRSTVWVPGALGPAFALLRHLPRGLWRRLPG